MKVKKCLGVYPGGSETIAMAQAAFQQNCSSYLDVGTGNGYIAIFLKKKGKKVDALDVSNRAVCCARKNARLNKCRLNVFQSDLFEQVKKKYDCITFIPPLNSDEKEYQRVGKSIIRRVPFLMAICRPFFYSAVRESRIKFVIRFLDQAKHYLNDNGQVLISLPIGDTQYIGRKIKEICQPMKSVAIYQIKYD